MTTELNQHNEWLTATGSAYPLGASSIDQHSWNFAVYAPDASGLWLCLFCADTEEPLAEIAFYARTGEIWHLQVQGITPGTLYGFRSEGVCHAGSGLVFDRNRLLIDPYAKQLNRALVWNERLYQVHSHYMVPKGILKVQEFDWQNSQKPRIAREKTIVYEAHVKGLTKLNPDVPAEQRGKYPGMCHPSVIRHLKDLGITTVQLLPVASFMTEPRLEKLKLTNYWGYNPINFFAPDARYQLDDAVTEFKQLVRTYHQHGLEVILDVVFNHTAEAENYSLSFRGLANRHYYLFENHADITDYQQNCNYSGCGNTLNVAHPMTQRLVLDALRYWATEMQVDGFRFDLAVTLAREHKRFDPYATFLQVIAQDPVLSQLKLIAEPWDLGPFGYQLGQFPAHWSELNDKCRDTFRSFWRQDPGQLPDFATRLLGSRDIFQKHHKPACCSVNYLSYHDGFTLHDLVCYQDKHNWLNAEQNRDGHGHNLSLNFGVEGHSTDPVLLKKRFQHKRNLVATLMLSQGIVHWLGGDELSQTQKGNNNAYCQDNEISWLNWQLDFQATQFLQFVKKMIALRQQFSCLQQLSLLDDQYQLHGDKHQVSWYLADGRLKQDEHWTDPYKTNCIFVVEDLKGQHAMLVIMNASEQPLEIELPKKGWQLLLDTQFDTGEALEKSTIRSRYLQPERSLSIWF